MRTLPAVLVALLLLGCTARPNARTPDLTGVPSGSATASAGAAGLPAPIGTVPRPSAAASPARSAAVPPACSSAPRPVGDIALVGLCPDGAELRIAASLGEQERAAIVAQVRDDLVAVQREFAWTLRSPAIVYVLAGREGYVAALERLFGYASATAAFVADNSVAFFEPSLRLVAVRWDAVRDRPPIAAIRHELAHVVTLEACAPRCDLVPAWLNEGEAHLLEATMPGSEWRLVRVRYEAASMLATGTLVPLGALWTQAQWNSFADWMGYYKYQEAARAVELLREDVGYGAIARLYARIRSGQDVATAYAALAGRPFAAFTATLGDRIREGAAAPRGVTTVTAGADGGVSFLLYGFAPEARITLRIRSHLVDETREIAVSPQGAWFGGIDASYPQGAYTITAADGDPVAAVTVVKRGGRAVRASPLD